MDGIHNGNKGRTPDRRPARAHLHSHGVVPLLLLLLFIGLPCTASGDPVLGTKDLKTLSSTGERQQAGRGGVGGGAQGGLERTEGPASNTENVVGRVKEFEQGVRTGLTKTASVIRQLVNNTRSTSFFSFKFSMPSGAKTGTAGAVLSGDRGASDGATHGGAGGSSEPVLQDEDRERLAAFVERHFSFPGEQVCGKWTVGYSALHRLIREGKAPKKYITYRPTGDEGLGDRLLGVVTTFVTALLSDRAIIIDDPFLSTSFQPEGVDWRVGPDVPLTVTNRNISNVEAGDVLELTYRNGLAPGKPRWMMVLFPADAAVLGQRFAPADNVILRTNGGILTTIFQMKRSRSYQELSRMGMVLDKSYMCILRLLMRPRVEVAAKMEKSFNVLHRGGKPGLSNTICVQMRVRDDHTWNLATGQPLPKAVVLPWVKGAQKQLLGCANNVMKAHKLPEKKTKWLFMSESMALRELARDLYPQYVTLSSIMPRHPGLKNQTAEERIESMRSTVADWLLFSTCHHYVIVNSGFSKTSVAYSASVKSIVFFQRPQGWWLNGNCRANVKQPASLQQLGAGWSGL